METKRNQKYFTAPAVSIPAIIAWAIIALGAFIVLTGGWMFLGITIAGAGFAFLLITTGGKSTDGDIEFQISERIKDLQEMSEKKHEVYEKHFLKLLRPIDLRGYDFITDKTPFFYKKGADGIQRTNYFVGTNLIFTNEKMVVYSRKFSLLDESIDEFESKIFYFTELDRAEVEECIYEHVVGGKTTKVKYYIFRIYTVDGSAAVEMCVDYGADIDRYVEQVSRVIVTRKRELEKRAIEAAERRAAFRAKLDAEKAEEAAATK